jgi:hypothetical protein
LALAALPVPSFGKLLPGNYSTYLCQGRHDDTQYQLVLTYGWGLDTNRVNVFVESRPVGGTRYDLVDTKSLAFLKSNPDAPTVSFTEPDPDRGMELRINVEKQTQPDFRFDQVEVNLRQESAGGPRFRAFCIRVD